MTDRRSAIVTGGSRGLGRAVAGLLCREGWRVVIDGRDAPDVEEAARSTGATALSGDVTDPRHRSALLEAVGSHLDLLVNNASDLGPSPLPPLSGYPLEALRRVYETNAVAPLAFAQLALPLLRASHGAIVNVTSDAAVEAYGGWGGYGSSKAALDQLSNVLAVEEPDVRVWWLDPGDLRTEMHQAAFPGEDISDRPDPETAAPALLALLARRPPSGRVAAAQLLAGASRAAEVGP